MLYKLLFHPQATRRPPAPAPAPAPPPSARLKVFNLYPNNSDRKYLRGKVPRSFLNTSSAHALVSLLLSSPLFLESCSLLSRSPARLLGFLRLISSLHHSQWASRPPRTSLSLDSAWSSPVLISSVISSSPTSGQSSQPLQRKLPMVTATQGTLSLK